MTLDLTSYSEMTEEKLNEIMERNYSLPEGIPDAVLLSSECIKYMEDNWTYMQPVFVKEITCECCGHKEDVYKQEKRKFRFDENKVHIYDSDYGAIILKRSNQ